MLVRGGDLARDLLDRTWAATRLVHHPWWENAALLDALGYDLPARSSPAARSRAPPRGAPDRRGRPASVRAPVAVHRRHPVPAARVEQRVPPTRPSDPGSCTASACRSSSACATCEPRSARPARRRPSSAARCGSATRRARPDRGTARRRSPSGPGRRRRPAVPRRPACPVARRGTRRRRRASPSELNWSQSHRQVSSVSSPSMNTRSTGSPSGARVLAALDVPAQRRPAAFAHRSPDHAAGGPRRAAPAGGEPAAVDERVDQVQHGVERQGAREHERDEPS